MSDNDNDNAKNPAWKVPMDLPGVKPEAYKSSIDSGRGSAKVSTSKSTKRATV
jgi:hypothetical protein